jgi:CheY-like chemotaxis protein
MASSDLKGTRILVVEDEILVSLLIEDALTGCGSDLVGPARTVAEGVALAQGEALSAAVLDVNVDSEPIYPVADILKRRGIPYLLVTGYRRNELPASQDDALVLEKPFEDTMLLEAVRTLLCVAVPS